MFIRDGIVYGGEPDAPMEVEYVKPLQDMMMLIRFNNGLTRTDSPQGAGATDAELRVFIADKLALWRTDGTDGNA